MSPEIFYEIILPEAESGAPFDFDTLRAMVEYIEYEREAARIYGGNSGEGRRIGEMQECIEAYLLHYGYIAV